MPNRDLNAKRYEIIFLERALLHAYYDVAKLVSTGQTDSPEYKKAVDKLQALYNNEQLYFLSLTDDLDTMKKLCDSFDGLDESEHLHELHDKNSEAIYNRVYSELSIGYAKRKIENEIRNVIPADEEIEPVTLWEYFCEEPLFYEYYDLLYKEQAEVYCTLEKVSAIHELVEKAPLNEREALINELFRIAFSSSHTTEEFLERLSNNNFEPINEKEIDQDCEIMLGQIYGLKDALHQTMECEMVDLISEYHDTENEFDKMVLAAQASHIFEYFQFEILEGFKEDIKELAPDLLPVIEHEMSIRNSYIHGKGECFDDYIIASKQQEKQIEQLIQTSIDLLNLYYSAAYYEIEGRKESDQYLSLITKIAFTQARESALLEDVIFDDDLYIILEQTLFTNGFETYFDKAKSLCDEASPISSDAAGVVKERLQCLFNQFEDDYDGQMDFSDKNINDYIEHGFDYKQPLERFAFYDQVLNIITAKKVDELIDESPNSIYFTFCKYDDFYCRPSMDQIVLDTHFDSKRMTNIDEEYLRIVAEVEEIDYNFLINTLAKSLQENIELQAEVIEELEEPIDPNRITYLNTKIAAIQETFPNIVPANQKTYTSEN